MFTINMHDSVTFVQSKTNQISRQATSYKKRCNVPPQDHMYQNCDRETNDGDGNTNDGYDS